MTSSDVAPQPNGELLVQVESVSRKFCRTLRKSLWYGVRDMAAELNPFRDGLAVRDSSLSDGPTSFVRPEPLAVGRNRLRRDEFWAVNDVSFELRRGECLGLIGRNGAGKTTLLKMLNGLIKPDSGRIEMRGRVGALIALGAGFNPILTGRENIYVNGSVLGLKKTEIDQKVEEIIAFSEVRPFIDSPVQSYSSGMQVRLGFAIASALEPDILLLDEVLAVGDTAFRNKCYRRVVSLRKKAAVIFVSHNMDFIARMCDRALVMSGGTVICLGTVEEGVSAYERINAQGEHQDDRFLSINDPISEFGVCFEPNELESGEPFVLKWRVVSSQCVDNFMLRILVYNAAGGLAADGTFSNSDYSIRIEEGVSQWEVRLQSIPLKRGSYQLGFNLIDRKGDFMVWSHKNHRLTVTDTFAGSISDCQLGLSTWKTLDPQQDVKSEMLGRWVE